MTAAATATEIAPRRHPHRQALLIALRGVDAMYRALYDCERIDDCRYAVTKPDGTEYQVLLGEGGAEGVAYCTCPFSGCGRANPTCKHVEFVRSVFGLYRPDMELEFAPRVA